MTRIIRQMATIYRSNKMLEIDQHKNITLELSNKYRVKI